MTISFKNRWPAAYPLTSFPQAGTVFKQLGLDLEWNESGRPTIMGFTIADNEIIDSDGQLFSYYADWNEPLCRSMLGAAESLIGHNILGSDVPTLQRHLVLPIIPTKKIDTFLLFYLTNAHLCRARLEKPTNYDDANDNKHNDAAGGYMSLWAMSSLYTDYPNWKECRGGYGTGKHKRGQVAQWATCTGPCPNCNTHWYCAIDSRAPLIAAPALLREAQLKGVDHLIPLYEKVIDATNRMTEHGILINQDKLAELESTIWKRQQAIRARLPIAWLDTDIADSVLPGIVTDEDTEPINWNSVKQIKKYFKDKYGIEPKTTSEEDIRTFYQTHNFAEAGLLLELKECGKGLKSWFGERWLDQDGILHPQFKSVAGTGTGRWASKGPNFQNIPVRSDLGKQIRCLIIPRPGFKLYKADYKQAEARCVLYQSGIIPPDDLKQWMMSNINLANDDPGVLALGGQWNAIKSFMHAGHYGEGITLHTKEELRSTYNVDLQAKGALEVYPDWVYQGKIVCRTGVNLAERMYGRATHDYRRKALSLQRLYFSKFPQVLRWQQSVSERISLEGALRSNFGFYLLLYGFPFPSLKTGLAMLGSNPVAMFTNYAILRAMEDGELPLAQVHDELVWEFPESMPEPVAKAKIESYMVFEHEAMPGLKLPIDVSAGYSWGETREIAN